MKSKNQRIGVWPPTRAIARDLGVRHFLSDLPCPRNHVGLRLTRTGNCLMCKRENGRAADLARLQAYGEAGGKSLRREIDKRFRAQHKDECNAKKRDARAFDRFMRQIGAAP